MIERAGGLRSRSGSGNGSAQASGAGVRTVPLDEVELRGDVDTLRLRTSAGGYAGVECLPYR